MLDTYFLEYQDDPDFIAEGMAITVLEDAIRIMQGKGLTRADLANLMGVSRAHISRLFNAPPNLTLRTIAHLAVALGVKSFVCLDREDLTAKYEHQMIKNIVSSKPRTVVRPREFLIAWSGVPTLVYQGFTPTLLKIKEELQQMIPSIKPENQGSKWPKTTLGALRDDKQLSWDDLCLLRNICSEFDHEISKSDVTFSINHLQVVVFQCRSLEKRLVTYQILLNPDECDVDAPPKWHLDEVTEKMGQFSEERLERYFADASRPGNTESHYRMPHIESTLIYDLPNPADQPSYIEGFIEEVNKQLPGLYCWFAPDSRHMTVRALS